MPVPMCIRSVAFCIVHCVARCLTRDPATTMFCGICLPNRFALSTTCGHSCLCPCASWSCGRSRRTQATDSSAPVLWLRPCLAGNKPTSVRHACWHPMSRLLTTKKLRLLLPAPTLIPLSTRVDRRMQQTRCRWSRKIGSDRGSTNRRKPQPPRGVLRLLFGSLRQLRPRWRC